MKKETPKQHVELINDNIEEFDKAIKLFKQETLEEAIGNYIYSTYDNQPLWEIIENAAKFGAKWQQERSYSEEDVKTAFLDGWQLRDGDLPFPKVKNKWFEQFKKK